MKYLHSPVVLTLVFCVFCAVAWHTVENGVNKDLHKEVVGLEKQVVNLSKEKQVLEVSLEMFKSKLVETLPGQSKEIQTVYNVMFDVKDQEKTQADAQ